MPAFASEIVNRITVEPVREHLGKCCGEGWKNSSRRSDYRIELESFFGG
jgi:hypothetical protein